MPKYIGKIGRWAQAHGGDILRYAALPAGGLAGGITFYSTGNAVAAENAMVVPALMFMAGEAYNAVRHFEGNAIEKAGKVASVLASAVASYFLSDGSYNPALTFGMIAPYGLAKGAEGIGNGIETKKYEEALLAEGRSAMLDKINQLPDKNLANVLASARRRK